MSKITDLRKYKESKEFQEIIDKCKNRQESKQAKLLELYKDWHIKEQLECVYSNHDVNSQRMVFTKARLEEIKDTSEGAKILRADLQEQIDRTEDFLTLGIRDQYGITNSSQIFDKIDLIRCDIQDNRYFQTQLDWMIVALEEEKEKEEPVYDEQPKQD